MLTSDDQERRATQEKILGSVVALSRVAEKDRVPFWQKVAYGVAGSTEILVGWIPQGNLTAVFNVAFGLDPGLLGMIVMLWRLSDAVTDQIMGHVSDNARTRWGRRRPFLIVGAILTAVTMPVLWWMPHGLPPWAMFGWLLVAGILLYSCFSVWAMPYYSLQLEMSPDYNERTNIGSYRAFFMQFFGVGAGWVLAFAALPVFSRLPGGKPDLANGMRYISLGLAALVILLGVLPGLFVPERYYEKETSRQKKEPFWQGFRQTFSTRPFLWILVIVFSKTFGFGLTGTLGFYLSTYYVCRGDLTLATLITGSAATATFLPNLVAIPFCTWVANRWDKKTLLYLTAFSGVLGSLSIYGCITPAHPWLQLVPALLMGPIGIGLWLLVPSMQSDVADYDELMTGLRREGSFSATFSWTLKATIALSGGLSGWLLVVTGFNVAKGMAQPPEVFENLKLVSIWVPIAFLIVSMVAIHRYPLTRQRMYEIRAQLEARRGPL